MVREACGTIHRMNRSALSRFLLAGLVTAIVDGLFSSVLSVAFYGSTATRLFQGVASAVLGKGALEGGTRTALIGVLMHIGVAFAWSAVFLVLYENSSLVRRAGVIPTAAIYGPFVWMVMSLIVIPLLVHRPPSITIRWWIQFFGHMLFVGFPIVSIISRGGRR